MKKIKYDEKKCDPKLQEASLKRMKEWKQKHKQLLKEQTDKTKNGNTNNSVGKLQWNR